MRFTSVSMLNDRHEVIENATSGQDVTIALDYEIASGARLNGAMLQITFAGILGQPLFACSSESSVGDGLELLPRGRLLCRIPRLPLMPGAYTYTIWCTVGGNLEDFVSDAGQLSVVEGDFFGTGRLPPKTVGDFLVAHQWTVA
jgi:lipopolysaccharide transport system ATP-binding protein